MEFDLLGIERGTFLKRIDYHDEIDSTNTRGVALCSADDVETPLLILAEKQTQGRGRGNNRWWSHDGALTMTLILSGGDIRVPFENWSLISLVAGLAVADALTEIVPDDAVRVKWPNDVYLAGKKICGILCEIPAVRPPRLVLGMGLNVNNSLLTAPLEIRERSTSLTDLTGLLHDRNELLVRLLQRLEDRLKDSHSLAPDLLPDIWSERCLLTGKEITVDCGGVEWAGRCLGIDAHGALLIERQNQVERLIGGTVTSWR
ncbi:MAG: biotin--[acetyl-CoA-carboxylase] ligase [Planctomycetota bacterium]|nr:biotin--[acetyl-CoA-carboxylase] ligase [Planctomycetota bacterium]MDA1215082.1 biotin--[acetyl-CoA-carboxylase] ligase [Planctomycetota bacterium]